MGQRANILLNDASAAGRLATSTHLPALHLGATLDRGLRGVGFDTHAICPAAASLLRQGWAHRRYFRNCRVTAVCQGFGVVALNIAKWVPGSSATITHTWKVPGIGPTRLGSRANDMLLARAIRKSQLVVVITANQARQMAERFPRTPVAIVPAAADVDFFRPGLPTTDVLSTALVRPGEYVLCVGDIDRDEDLPVRLAMKLDRPLVRVTRDPRTAERAREASSRLGLKRVAILERIPYPALRDVYANCFFLLTTPTKTYHPAGLTTLTESAACGVPVLFPRSVTTEGYVTDDVDALLFDEMTLDSILPVASRLEDSAVRSRISAAARHTAETRLNLDAAGAVLTARLRDVGLTAG